MSDGYQPPGSRPGFIALRFTIAVALLIVLIVLFFFAGGFMHGD